MERKTFSPCPYCNGRDNNCADCEVQAYRAIGTVEELASLVKARDEGLIQPMSCTGCRYDQTSRLREHEAHCMRCIRNRYPEDHYTRAEAEAALQEGDTHESN